MTQPSSEAPHFGPSWPEVTGFGAGPNKQKYATVATVALLADLRAPQKRSRKRHGLNRRKLCREARRRYAGKREQMASCPL